VNKASASAISDKRLKEVMEFLQTAPLPTPREELQFLTGRAHYLMGHHLKAVNTLVDFVEQYETNDRAAEATKLAATIAGQMLNKPQWRNSPPARTAFVRAGRLLRKHFPDSTQARNLQYFIALTLEHNQEYQQAAGEYARVTPDHPQILKAALGQGRCLVKSFNLTARNRTQSEVEIKQLAQKALQAARQGARTAQSKIQNGLIKEDRCLAAEIVLLLANLLNNPYLNLPAEALTTLQDFETRYSDCPDAIGPALRERILAHRQLKQLARARQVVEQYLTASPATAGPVMAKLLEAMRDEINSAAEGLDRKVVNNIATEAHQLAQMLLDWCKEHTDQVSSTDLLTIRTWHAWSLLKAGKPADALKIFQAGQDQLPTNAALNTEIRLGQAECLLALDRPVEALTIFMEVWQTIAERSPNWWRAYAGSLQAHTNLNSDPHQILQSIAQQRYLNSNLGGPRWKQTLETIEKTNQTRIKK
ncbi:MAG: tetratricopeptide repeat protein, partial [Planctomycetota bacterium]|jgi:hypothetical protein